MHASTTQARDRPPARLHPRGGVIGQVALVVTAWVIYSLARSLSGDDVGTAIRHGRVLLDWDQALGFGWTLGLNHWVTQHAVIAVPFAFEYASLHYLVTPLVLVWLWVRRPDQYRAALSALIVMSAVGLVCYVLLPVAPPRLLPDSGWVDTMRAWSHVGWWGGGASAPAGLEHLTDQYAAMPSLHVGWAVWCAWVWRSSRSSRVRRLGWIYPASIATAVIVTANHYVLDVAAGVLIAAVACSLVPRLMASRPATPGPLLPRPLAQPSASGASFGSISPSTSSASITSFSASDLAAPLASSIFSEMASSRSSRSSLSLMPRILRRIGHDHDRR